MKRNLVDSTIELCFACQSFSKVHLEPHWQELLPHSILILVYRQWHLPLKAWHQFKQLLTLDLGWSIAVNILITKTQRLPWQSTRSFSRLINQKGLNSNLVQILTTLRFALKHSRSMKFMGKWMSSWKPLKCGLCNQVVGTLLTRSLGCQRYPFEFTKLYSSVQCSNWHWIDPFLDSILSFVNYNSFQFYFWPLFPPQIFILRQ